MVVVIFVVERAYGIGAPVVHGGEVTTAASGPQVVEALVKKVRLWGSEQAVRAGGVH